jgi:hypothetical protein
MRLEPLFEGTLRYEGEGVWVFPYRGEEGAGFGTGSGEIVGERLRGSVRWANHPRRREDGVWLPDLHGVIHTIDGADVLVTMKGQSVQRTGEPVRRAVTCAVTFKTDHERYMWLNVVFAVLEGQINEETATIIVRAFQCINEVSS